MNIQDYGRNASSILEYKRYKKSNKKLFGINILMDICSNIHTKTKKDYNYYIVKYLNDNFLITMHKDIIIGEIDIKLDNYNTFEYNNYMYKYSNKVK